MPPDASARQRLADDVRGAVLNAHHGSASVDEVVDQILCAVDPHLEDLLRELDDTKDRLTDLQSDAALNAADTDLPPGVNRGDCDRIVTKSVLTQGTPPGVGRITHTDGSDCPRCASRQPCDTHQWTCSYDRCPGHSTGVEVCDSLSAEPAETFSQQIVRWQMERSKHEWGQVDEDGERHIVVNDNADWQCIVIDNNGDPDPTSARWVVAALNTARRIDEALVDPPDEPRTEPAEEVECAECETTGQNCRAHRPPRADTEGER